MPEPFLHLFEGGPFESLWRRSGLDRVLFATLRVRHVLVWAVVWLPMLALALWQGVAIRGTPVPFLLDFETQARFLIALPLLLLGQPFADAVLGMALGTMPDRGIIRSVDRDRFRALLDQAGRWSRGLPLTAVVFAAVLLAATSLTPSRWDLAVPAWHGTTAGDHPELTAAGSWAAFVAVPVFQFVLFRWLLRLMIWWVLLLRIARLDLHLVLTHPDRAGGLGILGHRITGFAPFLVSQGVLLSGTLGNRIAYLNRPLQEMWPEAAAYGSVVLVLILAPYMSFSPPLLRAKVRARLDYGLLSSRYVNEFERKWVRGEAAPGEPLVGSADIQSLADLAGSMDIVSEVRSVPFGKDAIAKVLVPFLLPIVPLIFTMIPAAELVKNLIKIIL